MPAFGTQPAVILSSRAAGRVGHRAGHAVRCRLSRPHPERTGRQDAAHAVFTRAAGTVSAECHRHSGRVAARGEAEAHVRALVRQATEQDYVILTDGMTGLGRIAEDEAYVSGGRVISFLSGSLMERIEKPMLSKLIEEKRSVGGLAAAPEALPTRPHGLTRGRCLYAQATAAFVFGCELKRGDTWQCAADALRDRSCDYVYAWEPSPYPGNRRS